ncbi:m-AAA protease-interacting protein 1, mitochondrial isoform X2 [Odontomachus brunneus]|uniref:m-AAA protease-interacting protein 1, mitochondrial isoform X2 n=1 Tax=Odontomachus brunneus TaxID=486640 RepID=UPI0013F1F0E3|nr:m-AAA protease-interacting protein 1, mitochondrial isoform X2 [Odontomachus brunneus]
MFREKLRKMNKTKIKVAQYYDESNLLSTSFPHLAACRIYSTERDSQPRVTLPMLVEDARVQLPSVFAPLKLLYLSTFKIFPHIDKEFDAHEVVEGAKYASIVISKALSNKDFESLQGLVTDDMIEILSRKIETFSPNERQLIELNNDNIIFYVLSDITATTSSTSSEHSIEIATMCHYMPSNIDKRSKTLGPVYMEYALAANQLICNYKFIRKYVNNIGGPWIATFVNHYTV